MNVRVTVKCWNKDCQYEEKWERKADETYDGLVCPSCQAEMVEEEEEEGTDKS